MLRQEIYRYDIPSNPWWTLGSVSGYHGFTLRHLIGERVHRNTGKLVSSLFQVREGSPLQRRLSNRLLGARLTTSVGHSGLCSFSQSSTLQPDSVTARTILNQPSNMIYWINGIASSNTCQYSRADKLMSDV